MKKLFYSFLLILSTAVIFGLYLYSKKPADTRDEKIDYTLSATDLIGEFTINEEAATKKYADKTILVSGVVTEINQISATLFLDASDPLATVTCSFYPDELPLLEKIEKGDNVSVKGKCTGKLIDVVLNNCRLVSSK